MSILTLVITFQIAIFIAHIFLALIAIRVFRVVKKGKKVAVFVLFLILASTFMLATFLSNRYTSEFIDIYYLIASSWLGFSYILFWSFIDLWLLRYVINKLLRIPVGFFIGRALDSKSFILIWILIAVSLFSYGFINARVTDIKREEISIKNLPAEWEGKKMVFISDVHLGDVYGKSFAENLVKKINTESPDIVLIGGDLFDGQVADYESLILPFKDLKSTYGTYFISGNHEEMQGKDKIFTKIIKDAGINVLDESNVLVGGMYFQNYDYTDAKKVSTSSPVILLKHSPSGAAAASEKGFSAQLSGHTHGGQIFPGNIMIYAIYGKQYYGKSMVGEMPVYTSSGVGTWGIPMRLGSHSEILVYTVRGI